MEGKEGRKEVAGGRTDSTEGFADEVVRSDQGQQGRGASLN
jgi:hypothetical protein